MSTTLRLEPLDGGLRARVDEGSWAGLLRDLDTTPLPGALAPSAPPTDVDAAPEVGHAARLVAGVADLQVELRSRAGSLGVLGLVRSDGAVCASVVRRVDASSGRAEAVPGVELSVFGVEALVDEVLRLVPDRPDGLPDESVAGPREVALPLEAAVMLSRAVAEEQAGLADRVAGLAGLDEVPPLVESLSHALLGEVTVGTTVPAARSGALRSWLVCSLGWVAVEVGDGVAVHRLVAGEEVRDDLVFDLTGALTVLAVVREDGDG